MDGRNEETDSGAEEKFWTTQAQTAGGCEKLLESGGLSILKFYDEIFSPPPPNARKMTKSITELPVNLFMIDKRLIELL